MTDTENKKTIEIRRKADVINRFIQSCSPKIANKVYAVCNVIDGEYELLYVVIKLLSVEGFPSASIKT